MVGQKTTANIGLAIVGQTVVNLTLVILSGFCPKNPPLLQVAKRCASFYEQTAEQ